MSGARERVTSLAGERSVEMGSAADTGTGD